MTNNRTFLTISNKDIYAKLCDIESQVMMTNGKVKLNTWRSITALTLVISVLIGLIGNNFGVFS